MKKLLMMAAMTFGLFQCFSDTLTIPVGNGKYEGIGISSGDYYDNSHFSLKDANADGYLDIVEHSPMDSGSGGEAYTLYVYNPKEQKFEEGKYFSNLIIQGDGTINTSGFSNRLGTSGSYEKYKWNGKKFKLISSESFFLCGYDSDSITYGSYTVYDFNSQEDKVQSTKYYKWYQSDNKTEVSKSEFERMENKFF